MSEESLIQPTAEPAPEEKEAPAVEEVKEETGESTIGPSKTINIDLTDPDPGADPFHSFKDENGLIAGKYKDGDALVKGYQELSKKLGEKTQNAPEEYEPPAFNAEGVLKDEQIPLNDPLLEPVLPIFKKYNIPQEGLNEIAEAFLTAQLGVKINPEDELGKLGADKEDIIHRLNTFTGKFNEGEQAILQSWVATADEAKLFNKVVKMTESGSFPGEAAVAPKQSKDELLAEAFKIRDENPKFKYDLKLQKQYNDLLTKAHSV
jgi:hypothetical protein